ncbi:MAG TPA: hypothetical protein VMI11_06405 [Actinomycetes bacterium]|nr:hypothetical protein [Actinomycetes bacterium]
MSTHAHRPSTGTRLGVWISCVLAGVLALAAGIYLVVTQGRQPWLLVTVIGTPIVIGLVAAVATLIVTPVRARQLRRQVEAEQARQREVLGREVLITDAVARFFHPVPAAHVPLGKGEITAYSSGYLAFDNGAGGYYRTQGLDGWRQAAEGEFVLECSPLYQISVYTKHAPQWRAWLTQFHGADTRTVVIDLSAGEPHPQPAGVANGQAGAVAVNGQAVALNGQAGAHLAVPPAEPIPSTVAGPLSPEV